MRNQFPGYYRLSATDLTQMWKDGIFILDANVLLDLFRYSDETRSSLLTIMQRVSGRLWIPHQAALEYHKHLYSVIAEQAKAYDEVINDIKKLLEKFNSTRRHPFLDKPFNKEVEVFFDKLNTILEKKKDSILSLLTNNPVKERVANILEGKIGEPFSEDRLEEIYKKGEKRYEAKIPPGYSDAKSKQGNEKFGDLILWEQILEKAKDVHPALIFITGDTKEDWFLKVDPRTIGPRPELIGELKKTKNILFYIYTTDTFLTHAQKYLSAHIKKESLDEVKERVNHMNRIREIQPPVMANPQGANAMPAPGVLWTGFPTLPNLRDAVSQPSSAIILLNDILRSSAPKAVGATGVSLLPILQDLVMTDPSHPTSSDVLRPQQSEQKGQTQ